MRVGARLQLAALPAVVGAFLVAALAYWGRADYQAPRALVIIAVVVAIASGIISWRNTRYVAQRVEQLAAPRTASARTVKSDVAPSVVAPSAPATEDELDQIAATVAGLSTEVAAERSARMHDTLAADARVDRYAGLLDEALGATAARLREVQLPLHILLDSPFGELNENQEEMLGAARQAVDDADVELRRIRRLLDIERGAIDFVQRPIGVAELLRPSIAIASARAPSGVRVVADVPDTLRRVVTDPLQTQDAMTSVIASVAARASAGSIVTVRARDHARDSVQILVGTDQALAAANPDVELRLATAVLEAQRATVTRRDDGTTVTLSSERL
jgi:signal transduction histidine kinase